MAKASARELTWKLLKCLIFAGRASNVRRSGAVINISLSLAMFFSSVDVLDVPSRIEAPSLVGSGPIQASCNPCWRPEFSLLLMWRVKSETV